MTVTALCTAAAKVAHRTAWTETVFFHHKAYYSPLKKIQRWVTYPANKTLPSLSPYTHTQKGIKKNVLRIRLLPVNWEKFPRSVCIHFLLRMHCILHIIGSVKYPGQRPHPFYYPLPSPSQPPPPPLSLSLSLSRQTKQAVAGKGPRKLLFPKDTAWRLWNLHSAYVFHSPNVALQRQAPGWAPRTQK